jgi:ribosomal-protein-alanine N-acetyltransferase
MTDPRPWSAEEFASLLAQPSTHLSACAQAFALGRTAAGEAELLSLATLPYARRRGLARRHLAGFEAAARACGADVAFLEVAADNAAALALYASEGWRETGRRAGYYRRRGRPDADALLLRKNLGGEPPIASRTRA